MHAFRLPATAFASALAATFALALSASPVALAACSTGLVTFTSTGSEQCYTVPAGITSVHVVAIGAGGGLVFDHFVGPGWFKRQVVGAMPSLITSALVGVAGAFVGFHIALSLALSSQAGLVGAALGTAAVLFGWRTVR